MGRGVTYFCSDDPDRINTGECERDLYDYIDVLGVDYVEDENADSARERIVMLIDDLRQAGAETGETKDGDGNTVSYFVLDDDVRRNWFGWKLASLKQKVAGMTLEEFIKGNATLLTNLISDEYDDCIVNLGYGNYPNAMDDFMRDAETGKRYYLSNSVVFMH